MPNQDNTTKLQVASADSLLAKLRTVVKEKGYCSEEDMKKVALEVNVPLIDVYEVATFYSFLNTEPKGKHIIRICHSPSCYINNSDNLVEAVKEHLQIEVGGTTADGQFTLELTSCIGCCDLAPAALIDGKLYTNLTNAKLKEIINQCK